MKVLSSYPVTLGDKSILNLFRRNDGFPRNLKTKCAYCIIEQRCPNTVSLLLLLQITDHEKWFAGFPVPAPVFWEVRPQPSRSTLLGFLFPSKDVCKSSFPVGLFLTCSQFTHLVNRKCYVLNPLH